MCSAIMAFGVVLVVHGAAFPHEVRTSGQALGVRTGDASHRLVDRAAHAVSTQAERPALHAETTPMKYTIRPLLNGECVIAGNDAFYEGDPSELYPYALMQWLIEGGECPMLVDAGLGDVEEMNRGAAHVLAENCGPA